MKHFVRVMAAGAAAGVMASAGASAGQADPVTYQGILEKHGAPAPDGPYSVFLQVWDAETGGTVLAQAAFLAEVRDGLFSIELPTTGAVGAALSSPGPVWLGVVVRDPQTFENIPLEPRQRVGAAPRANLAAGLASLTAEGGVLELFDEGAAGSGSLRILANAPLGLPLPGGSTFGTVVRPVALGHMVIDIAANDPGDAFVVRTDSDFDGAMDAIPFYVRASGVTHMTDLRVTGPSLFTGVSGSLVVADFTSSRADGTFLRFGHAGLGDEKPWIIGLSMAPGYEGRFNIEDHDMDGGPAVSIGFDDLLVRSEVTVQKAITINGSDLAEKFDVAARAGIEPAPGMVVSIDGARPGSLAVCEEAYDRRVAGVISGANGIMPALHLRQPGTIADGAYPVAMSGRVFVLADADAGGPIRAGDLLTTSATPGHAMRATDRGAMHGAVIGKAMTTLESGRGMVLVLVNLH